MPEFEVLALVLTSGPGPDVTPVDAAASSIVTYWLSFGAIAVVAFTLFFLYVWPGKGAEKIRSNARADLLEENKRLLARAEKAEEQRDESMRLTQERVVPILGSFTATTTALIPLLQELVARGERHERG